MFVIEEQLKMVNMKMILFFFLFGSMANAQNISMNAAEVQPDGYNAQFMGRCYFPAEFQGEFLMQVSGTGPKRSNNNAGPIQYSSVNISYDSIPVWGYCQRRIGDNVLLIDSFSEAYCIRCIRLKLRSPNIIEVFSENLNKCYTYESGAIESCNHLNTSAILYRTKEFGGYPIRNEFCPIAGRYRFKYNINDGSEEKNECNSFSSELDNCPDGSMLHLQFKKCSFENHDLSFNCLGSWAGPNNSRYLALMDSQISGESRPQYRCGLYHIDNKGRIYLAFSSDSSCTENLENSTSGYETLVLTRTTNQRRVPDYVTTHLASYPKWAQGEWQESLIVNGTMTFNDLNGYHSYTFVTVDSNEENGRYIVYSKDHCEQEAFLCLIMRQRSENVLEFKIGTALSTAYARNLCDDSNLDKVAWMTQSRIERVVESPCPITGHYIGKIPDLPGTCAELSSNCNTREIMYFKVTDCNTGELFEERTYVCLGQWEEKGVMYTYTKRNDSDVNECFVGLIVNDEEIYIKEAGNHCLRNIDPRAVGMRLYKKGQCYGSSASPAPVLMKPIPHDPIMRITSTTQTIIAVQSTTTPRPSSAPRLSTSLPDISTFLALIYCFINYYAIRYI